MDDFAPKIGSQQVGAHCRVRGGLLKIEILFFSLTGNLDVQLDQVFKNYV